MACWIAGFDIIYALLDLEFDRAAGIHSIPARFGAARGPLGDARAPRRRPRAARRRPGSRRGRAPSTWWASAVCGAVLAYENTIVGPRDTSRVSVAFAQSNGLLAVVFLVFTLLEVTL